jgi:hypothetical protein
MNCKQRKARTERVMMGGLRVLPRSRSGRRAAAPAMIIAAGLLLAACGGSGASPSASRSSTFGPAVGFSACMRSHGLAEFPDPDSHGNLPKVTPQQLGVSTSQFNAARSACAHLLRPSTGQAQQTLNGMRDFARCMRSHGVRNWPDPTIDGDGRAVFDLHGRVNPDGPQANRASDECSHLLQPPPGEDGVVLCNGIGEAGCHHYGRPAG